MRNIKLTIEYDGSKYHGWQSQLNAISVQAVIESALEKLTGEECKIIGASRTDTGVHALGQVANFTTHAPIPPDKYFLALNTILPNDVVIVKSEEVAEDFHSRFWAKGKRYRYLIYNSKAPTALLRNRAYHVPVALDVDAMRSAANCFLGTHDFSAFKATGGSAKTSERTMRDVLINREDNIIKFEIEGDGFLYNMVRIIVGTLVDVGMGKIAAEDIPKIIAEKDRKQAGRTAPPQGLYLVKVFYE